MTDAAPEAPAQEQPTAEQPTETPAEPKVDETDWKAEARKWEQRAKDNNTKAQEFDKQRKAAMTEAERAVSDAEERGRTAATQEYGKRLATAEIRTVAAEAKADLAGVFDYLDLARFVGEDGEPDAKAIKAFVAGLPRKDANATPTVDLDLGTRTTPPAPAGDMNQLIRKGFGRTG